MGGMADKQRAILPSRWTLKDYKNELTGRKESVMPYSCRGAIPCTKYRLEAKQMGSSLAEEKKGCPGGLQIERDPTMCKRKPVVSETALGVFSPG